MKSIILILLLTGCASTPPNPLATPPKIGKELNIQTKGECSAVQVDPGHGWDSITTSECYYITDDGNPK